MGKTRTFLTHYQVINNFFSIKYESELFVAIFGHILSGYFGSGLK
jgi:hypothetical protein